MKKITLPLVILFGIIVAACASFPKDDIDIAAEADPAVDFSDYKTYAWLGSAAVLNDPEGKWEPPSFDMDSLITALIDKELTANGLQEVDSNPDLLVAYAIGADFEKMKMQEDKVTNVEILQNVPQSALVVTLMDAYTEEVAWAAVAVGEVQKKGEDVMKKRINYTISEMFKQYPKK